MNHPLGRAVLSLATVGALFLRKFDQDDDELLTVQELLPGGVAPGAVPIMRRRQPPVPGVPAAVPLMLLGKEDAPRRIISLPQEVHIPLPPDSPHRAVLEQTALNCPVHKSLPPEINRPTKFFWEG